LCPETEIGYQQKILVLEEQIEKLQGQVDRLKETALKEKQELRSSYSQLYKVK